MYLCHFHFPIDNHSKINQDYFLTHMTISCKLEPWLSFTSRQTSDTDAIWRTASVWHPRMNSCLVYAMSKKTQYFR